jgi:cell wall-associated NlpC family hydrolase
MAALRKAVQDETGRVEAIQAKAVVALGQVQAEMQTAAATQDRLTATLAQVKGDLVTLVNAERAGMAWQTYAALGGGKLLDFVPPAPLPGVLPQITAAIALATTQLGKPYVWGATGPDSFDCSGLMQWTFAQLSIKLPRVASDQQAWATPVPISQIQPGDLVFFGLPAHHVGMYVGNGLMLDAPHTGAVVEVAPIWWNELSGFGRVHV